MLASCHVKTVVEDMLLYKTKSRMCQDYEALDLWNLTTETYSAQGLEVCSASTIIVVTTLL